MPYSFTPPEFLQSQTLEDIHGRMLNALPEDLDKSEGGIAWDFTRPAALELARLSEVQLNETIAIMFPQWAYDKYLDLHAETVGLTRRGANKAFGLLEITGIAGTVIQEGFQFATASEGGAPSVLFETVSETVIGDTGTAEAEIRALEGGRAGNVARGTITLMLKPVTGIKSVTNPLAASGGAAEEDDESFRARILEAMRTGASFAGCDADYIRWAKEVPGVGQVMVLPQWNGAGTVKVVVTDADGLPANQQILDAVYDHIVSPHDRIKRLAPIGADVTVAPPEPVRVDISAVITLKAGANIEDVEAGFRADLPELYKGSADAGIVKYILIGAALAHTAGVYDYHELLVNGGLGNVVISTGQFPVTGEVSLIAED